MESKEQRNRIYIALQNYRKLENNNPDQILKMTPSELYQATELQNDEMNKLKVLRKEKGARSRGDSWYNEAPNIATMIKYYGCDFVTEIMKQQNIATPKIDGSQCGITVQRDGSIQGWSRNRELSKDEIDGTEKFGNPGAMENCFGIFTKFVSNLFTHMDSIVPEILKTITVTGEAYRAFLNKKSAKFTSIHPFQMIVELKNGIEIVMLMTLELHKLFTQYSSIHHQFTDIFDMSAFMIEEKCNHIFPVPIYFVGNRYECIKKGHELAINSSDLIVEGLMLTDTINPCFVSKLKTPQQMKGEFSSIKRLAPLGEEFDPDKQIYLNNLQDRETYEYLVDLYNRFLALTKNNRVDALRQKEIKQKAQNEEEEKADKLMPMIEGAFDKWKNSDAPKPGDLSVRMSKNNFYGLVAEIVKFSNIEIMKNLKECGDTLEKKDEKMLNKWIMVYIKDQLPAYLD